MCIRDSHREDACAAPRCAALCALLDRDRSLLPLPAAIPGFLPACPRRCRVWKGSISRPQVCIRDRLTATPEAFSRCEGAGVSYLLSDDTGFQYIGINADRVSSSDLRKGLMSLIDLSLIHIWMRRCFGRWKAKHVRPDRN